jgi:hypothetical protein
MRRLRSGAFASANRAARRTLGVFVAKSRDVPMRTHSAREVCVLKRHLPGEREGELGADFIYFVENTP